MKAVICIAGQIGGNGVLKRKLKNWTASRDGHHNCIYLQYENKTIAQNDLNKAYKSLKEEEIDPDPNLRLVRDSGNRVIAVHYDASTASII